MTHLNGNGHTPPEPRTELRHVGWYNPTAPEGRRISEHYGYQPTGCVPAYIVVEVGG